MTACDLSEIKRDIVASANFSYPFHLTCTVTHKPFDFLFKILMQTARLRTLLDGAKYCRKVQLSTWGAPTLQTDRRQTDRQTDMR